MKMPWLRATWQQLMATAQAGRLGHGIGIDWAPQLGSDRLIEQFSHWLLCQNKGNQQRACGQCKSCQLLRTGHHPDLIQCGQDATQSIGVDDIRRIQQKLNQSSHQHGEKVAVLMNAQLLTTAAANALLKTLEEPPGATTVIIASSAWQRLLPTIRSRLQHYPVQPPSIEALAQWLSLQGEQPINAQESLRGWCDKPLAALAALKEGALHESGDLAQMLETGTLAKPYKDVEPALDILSQLEWVVRDALWLHRGGALQECRLPEVCEQLALRRRCADDPELVAALVALQGEGTRVRQLLTGPKGLNVNVLLQGLIGQWHHALTQNQLVNSN